MAQTQYSTLSVVYDDVQEKPASLRKVTFVAAVLSAAVVMFFAGRVYEGQSTPFTHEEVLDISARCSDGEFIGGCVECKSCAAYEFHNGGCSFFKDAFCSYCEPIANCQRENIKCSTREDQICLQCDCNDPVANWTDIELGRYVEYEMYEREEFAGMSQEAATFSCYWEEQCLPCTVCDLGSFQTEPCRQDMDSQCQQCADCKEDQWVIEKCEYAKDTVCADCTHYMGATEDKWTSQKCYKFADTGPLYVGSDAVSSGCTNVGEAQWYSAPCTEFSDSEVTDCALCNAERDCDSMGGEYIDTYCEIGTKADVGMTTQCNACTNADDPAVEFMYEAEKCVPTMTTDAKWVPCTECKMGEYEHTPCRLSTDTICPPCYPLNHCKPKNTICAVGRAEDDNDSECIGNDAKAMDGPAFACEADFYGKQCSYWRTYADCGVGPGYRERTVRTGKFRGSTDGEFIAWCMLLCDEFPDCTAFEIGDEGDDWNAPGDAKLTKPNSLCSLKNIATGTITVPEDLQKDCFSNVARQSEANIRTIMEGTAMKLGKPLVFPGIGCVGGECMLEGDWLQAPEVASNPEVARMLVREAACVDMGGLAGEVAGVCDEECT
jgi:hypothetical protein